MSDEGSSLIGIEFKFPNYLARFQAQLQRLVIAIASDIQTNVGLRFDNEGAYNGHPKWKHLASGLSQKKGANGLQIRQILRGETGNLKNSMGPDNPTGRPGPGGYVVAKGGLRKLSVTVGSSLKYAAIHNNGGLIRHHGTSNGFGRGIKIPAHNIQMPRRNWTDWNERDNESMSIVIKNTIEEILDGR